VELAPANHLTRLVGTETSLPRSAPTSIADVLSCIGLRLCLLCADPNILTIVRPPRTLSGSPDNPLTAPAHYNSPRATLLFSYKAVPTQAPSNLKKEATPSSPHFGLFRVGAAWPRLGRAFRTAPVSRQTINQKRFVTNRAFTHALPPSSGLRSVPFTRCPRCFFPAAL